MFGAFIPTDNPAIMTDLMKSIIIQQKFESTLCIRPPDRLALLPRLSSISTIFVVELGVAVTSDGRVGPSQLLVRGLRRRSLVSRKISSS